ncbi:hypothetical protein [Algoriphagus sp. AK58]|uniref:hypothetical protein n=1 Tax=Algoriphagus sp. AK58 TaxID=1406877 RepID=UPI00164FB7F0|nr:hypothetical protein [Algoriphagus sp. AK58]MBC6368050.1 hypothetical protein [Algoriphagus sp. AK58]
MTNYYPELNQRILEMSEGDDEFREELTQAIYKGLIELKQIYSEGTIERDIVKIQQIRHKLKPTLSMFDFDLLTENLQKGKELLESSGFEGEFEVHFKDFIEKVDLAIQEVENLPK